MRIVVVGLGPGGLDALTVGALRELVEAPRLFIRTSRHPVVDELVAMGLDFTTFDDVYESAGDFPEVYRTIAERLLDAAAAGPTLDGAPDSPAPHGASGGESAPPAESYVVYAVPGHPTVAEESVALLRRLARARGIEVRLVPGMSWLDPALAVLGLDPAAGRGLTVIDALERRVTLHPEQSYLVTQVYDRLVAGDVKLRLAEVFGDTHRVKVLHHVGLPEARVATIALYRLDRLAWVDHLTSVYVPPLRGAKRAGAAETEAAGFPLDPIVEIMRRLRGADGCPWDRAQTHASLKPYMIEESYEVWEAIDEGDGEKLCDELGDLLLQIIFHCQLAAEAGTFDVNDVVINLCQKMIRRHPHVFGKTEVGGVGDVLRNWDQIKKEEHGGEQRHSVLDGIPRDLPGLAMAQKIQGKAAKVGFEWDTLPDAVKKVWEEARELQRAHTASVAAPEGTAEHEAARDHLEEEVGDLLFAVANVARYLKVHAEVALRRTVSKFYHRFRFIEEAALREGKEISDYSLDEMDALWRESKDRE